MPHDPYRSLYVHIPFCRSKCSYCDFHSKAVKAGSKWVENYVEFVVEEIFKKGREGELSEVETAYIGGGTPTMLGSKGLTSILYALGLSMNLDEGKEVTVEANPDSLDERLVKDLWALGVNRLSIGVQSFDDALLGVIGRVHDSVQAIQAVKTAKERFENVSIDLMCGLPGQTLVQFDDSLKKALELGVKHVSIYPLTIEKGTKFDRLMRKGRLELPGEDLVADMMESASRILQEAGMPRYEVASYAFPGFESRHNISYWTGKPYLGIGDSAVTMTQNDEARMRLQDGVVIDHLTPKEMAAEDLMLAMRMSRGVPEDYVEEMENGLLPGAMDEMERLEALGLVIRRDGRYKPTERGWMLGNELYGAILDLSR